MTGDRHWPGIWPHLELLRVLAAQKQAFCWTNYLFFCVLFAAMHVCTKNHKSRRYNGTCMSTILTFQGRNQEMFTVVVCCQALLAQSLLLSVSRITLTHNWEIPDFIPTIISSININMQHVSLNTAKKIKHHKCLASLWTQKDPVCGHSHIPFENRTSF